MSHPRGRRLRVQYRLSVADGALFAGMVGLGEFWFVTDAVRLLATPLAVAALVTLPQLIGALGSLAMLGALRTARERRSWVVAAVIGQAATLVALAAASAAHASSPWTLTAAACAYAAFGQAAGTAWSSWMGDLVPARIRGRWFGTRTRWVAAATFLGILAGGLLLQAIEPRDGAGRAGLGYALVYTLAAGLRLGSALLLFRSAEPAFHPPDAVDHPVGVLCGEDARAARGVVAVGAGMLVAVCVSTPFFAPYMLDTLGFSYVTYLGAQGVMVATKVAALGPWGHLVDKLGAVQVYRISAVLVALIPIPWLFADRAAVVYAAQALSGVAWGGNEVALLALTLAATSRRRRAVLLTAQSMANGVAQVGGGMLGSGMAALHPVNHAQIAFALSSVGRMLVGLASGALLAPLAGAPVVRDRLGTRVVAWLPSGGLVRQVLWSATRSATRSVTRRRA